MRLKQSIILLLSVMTTVPFVAQNWAKVSSDKFAQQLECLLYDSIHNKLIASSKFVNHVGNLNVRGIASWDGTRWDSLAGGVNTHNKGFQPFPNGMLLSGISYNGKFLAGGYFTSIGDVNTTGLALWDGVKWDSLPKRAFRYDKTIIITKLLKKGNSIYITGDFDTIVGQKAHGIATWDGSNFHPILLPVGTGYQGVTCIAEYKNEIYITAGSFDLGSGDVADVLKYNGTAWVSTTGGGFRGAYAGARELVVYNNELYASGHFTKAAANVGDNIMKWDGTQWKDIGFGNTPAFEIIYKTLVHKNKLWVFGSFTRAANSFASNVAVYDGVNWCGLKDTLDNDIGSAAVYKDTIYIGGGFWTANSDSIPFIAKLKDATLYNNCVNVGINEVSLSESIKIYPNPTSSVLNLIDEQNELQNSTIEITNSIGQSVMKIPFSSSIDVSTLPAGCYFITISTPQKNVLHTKFIKE